jgi:putative ATPase
MQTYIPLAEQLRPQKLSEFIGQNHLVAKDKPLEILYHQKQITSMIFWGPPGSGKTTLAKILAKNANANFYYLSAVSAGKQQVREIIEKSHIYQKIHQDQQLKFEETKQSKPLLTVLFLDEIHRFNKAQQDFLLPYVENGTLILIGATTENPSFEVNSALLSRCRVYVLKALSISELSQIITHACKIKKIKILKKAKNFLAEFSNGDARFAISTIELASQLLSLEKSKSLSFNQLKDILQKKALHYDKQADGHYDTISAFIKSMRASNIDSALYYLARMIDSGEDPKFIARRMIIFASEDIGLVVPTAIVVANEIFQAVNAVGLPEAQINLAHGVAYLCQCKKDRSAYNAYFKALGDVQKYGNLPIPLKIRNAPTKLMKQLDYGKDYEMYSKESLLPDKIKGKKYYSK